MYKEPFYFYLFSCWCDLCVLVNLRTKGNWPVSQTPHGHLPHANARIEPVLEQLEVSVLAFREKTIQSCREPMNSNQDRNETAEKRTTEWKTTLHCNMKYVNLRHSCVETSKFRTFFTLLNWIWDVGNYLPIFSPPYWPILMMLFCTVRRDTFVWLWNFCCWADFLCVLLFVIQFLFILFFVHALS